MIDAGEIGQQPEYKGAKEPEKYQGQQRPGTALQAQSQHCQIENNKAPFKKQPERTPLAFSEQIFHFSHCAFPQLNSRNGTFWQIRNQICQIRNQMPYKFARGPEF